MDKLGWSSEAHRRHKAAQSARKSPAQWERETERMKPGPRLEGHTLVVPSEWYNEQAVSFWKAHGFRWREWPACTWTRDTRRPASGKHYTANAWLKATRAKFYQFWPDLAPDGDNKNTGPRRPPAPPVCRQAGAVTTGPPACAGRRCQACGRVFSPINQHQVLCPNCENHHTGNWR